MKSNTKFIAAVVAAAVSTTMIAQIANATAAVKTETEQAGELKTSVVKIPETGKIILDGVHGARLALFDGNVDTAKDLISDAEGRFDEHTAKFALKLAGDNSFAIPVDSGLQFADGFQPTEIHAEAITLAGGHIQDGNMDKAVKVMTDAGVKLDVKVVVLPVEAAAANLKQALADIDAGNIHQANMALKAVESSIVVEDYQPGALPAQGYPLNEILPG